MFWWRGVGTENVADDDTEFRADRQSGPDADADCDRIADADADATTRGPGDREYRAAAAQ
jgi:hypothetical protein